MYDEVAAETAQLIAPPLIEMLRDPQSDFEFKVRPDLFNFIHGVVYSDHLPLQYSHAALPYSTS